VFNLKSLFTRPYGYYDYIWIDCTLIRETQKAVLIDFDDRKIWLPKAWILSVKKHRHHNSQKGEATSIKISLYNWAKKFS
jgi:hypothetical protein